MAADRSDAGSPPLGRILIADNEQGTTIPLRYLMEKSGYAVQSATSGEETLQAVADFKPDLILLEAMISNPDGFEICHTIRNSPHLAKTRILFVSAMARDMDIAKGLASGADGYITKPFSNSEIMDHVRKILEVADGSYQ
ncbi:MAG: response regulator [Desulfobacterales bacterium]|jgi:DNA-binding response OmpR family regulator